MVYPIQIHPSIRLLQKTVLGSFNKLALCSYDIVPVDIPWMTFTYLFMASVRLCKDSHIHSVITGVCTKTQVIARPNRCKSFMICHVEFVLAIPFTSTFSINSRKSGRWHRWNAYFCIHLSFSYSNAFDICIYMHLNVIFICVCNDVFGRLCSFIYLKEQL